MDTISEIGLPFLMTLLNNVANGITEFPDNFDTETELSDKNTNCDATYTDNSRQEERPQEAGLIDEISPYISPDQQGIALPLLAFAQAKEKFRTTYSTLSVHERPTNWNKTIEILAKHFHSPELGAVRTIMDQSNNMMNMMNMFSMLSGMQGGRNGPMGNMEGLMKMMSGGMNNNNMGGLGQMFGANGANSGNGGNNANGGNGGNNAGMANILQMLGGMNGMGGSGGMGGIGNIASMLGGMGGLGGNNGGNPMMNLLPLMMSMNGNKGLGSLFNMNNNNNTYQPTESQQPEEPATPKQEATYQPEEPAVPLYRNDTSTDYADSDIGAPGGILSSFQRDSIKKMLDNMK